MAADFINRIQLLGGTQPLDSINAYVGNADNADDPVTAEYGMYGRIVDKQAKVQEVLEDSTSIADTMYGDDLTNGSEGTVLRTIKDAEAHTVDLSGDVANIVEELLVTDVDGSDGIYGDIKTKHDEVVVAVADVREHYDDINVVGTDLTSDNSKLETVSSNMLKGSDSELLVVGADLLDADSDIKKVADPAYIDKINSAADISEQMDRIEANQDRVDAVADNIDHIVAVDENKVSTDTVYANIGAVVRTSDNVGNINSVVNIEEEITVTAATVGPIKEVATELRKGVGNAIVTVSDNLKKSYSEILNAKDNADRAEVSKNTAVAAGEKAEQWADGEGEIEEDRHSAKYWADRAAEVAAGAVIFDDDPGDDTTYSSNKLEEKFTAVTQNADDIAAVNQRITDSRDDVYAQIERSRQEAIMLSLILT